MELHSILKAVVAYVEVRSGNDNRSAAISQELKLLGAQVEPTFTDAVTHVVFKEGMKRTWNKAVKRKVHLVSVSWIDSCKQNQMQVYEKDFPAVLPETIASPLPRINQPLRWKKMKSMQPCDFDEELARSAERGEKKRKRIMMANRFTLTEEITPTSASPVAVLAYETQARRSPLLTAGSRTNSPIPDTPPSMQERLERMRREQRLVLGTDLDNSPPATPRAPVDKQLQRRLFDMFANDFASTGSSIDEDETTSNRVAELIQNLESSSSECGSQASAVRNGLKLKASEKSAEDSTLVKSPNQQTYSKVAASASPHKNGTEKAADMNKEIHVFPNKSEIKSVCSSLSLNVSTNQSTSTMTKDRSNKKKTIKNNENKSRSESLVVGNRSLKQKRMSSISNALSPKDTNTDDPSLNLKSVELQQNCGKLYSESKLNLEKTFVSGDFSNKSNVLLGDNMLGNSGADSATGTKYQNTGDVENPIKVVGAELRRKSRRLSKWQPGLSSPPDLSSENVLASTRACLVENDRKVEKPSSNVLGKTDIFTSNMLEGFSAALYDKPTKSSPSPVKPKTSRKKRGLFTEAASTASLQCPTETSRQKGSPETLSSHKTQGQTLVSDIKSDISFMFGTSKSKNTKQKEKQVKRKSKQLSTGSTKTSVVDLSGLDTDSVNCLPGLRKVMGGNLCKTTVEDNSASNYGQQNSSSFGESMLNGEMSMSIAYINDATLSNITRAGTSRRSLDEFSTSSRISRKIKRLEKISVPKAELQAKSKECSSSPNNSKTKGRNMTTYGKAQQNAHKTKRKRGLSCGSDSADKTPSKTHKNHSKSSSTDADTPLNESSSSLQDKIVPARLRHAHSLIMEQKFQPPMKRSAYSLVVTSLHRDEQETVYAVVKKLGVFHLTNIVEATSTHVVCGESRRTLNLLRAIASGCWLLRKEWVFESLEAGRWLQEENYEMTDFPAAIKSRTERQKAGLGYKVDLFSKLGFIFVSAACTPPRKEIVHLINLCCGHVTGSETRAAIHLGDEHSPTKLVIKPAWVLDCIMKLETLPTDDYIVFPKVLASQRESSPEF